jgi:hypothetical protein
MFALIPAKFHREDPLEDLAPLGNPMKTRSYLGLAEFKLVKVQWVRILQRIIMLQTDHLAIKTFFRNQLSMMNPSLITYQPHRSTTSRIKKREI